MTCAPGGACWCNAVALTDAVREQLRASYTDCLCPQCLQGAADTGANLPSRADA